MKTGFIVLLLATAALFVPSASASDLCVNDLCVDLDLVSDKACTATSTSSTGFWHYTLGDDAIRDPILPATYYAATWTYKTHYNQSCVAIGYSCVVVVGDGSYFQYTNLEGADAMEGQYKGIPVVGGSLSCSSRSAELHTFGAFLVAINGYGSR